MAPPATIPSPRPFEMEYLMHCVSERSTFQIRLV